MFALLLALLSTLPAAAAPTRHAPVHHDNGAVAWTGIRGADVYYDDGSLAWRGLPGLPVYDRDGAQLWSGLPGRPCTRPDGASADRCEAIVVELGPGRRLRVDADRAELVLPSAVIDLTLPRADRRNA